MKLKGPGGRIFVTPEEAAVGGMEMARRALNAFADGLDDDAYAVVNTGSHAETAWMAAYLLSALRESTAARFGNKPVRVALAMRPAARAIDEDLMETRLRLLVQEFEARSP
jgi:hypothetical protein